MSTPKVIIPANVTVYPQSFEISAVTILSKYFKSDIRFITTTKHPTPDVLINHIRWEIKRPIGKGKRNIQHQIQRALLQSPNIIIDARQTKMHSLRIKSELRRYSSENPAVKRLLLIEKNKTVTVIKE